MMLWGVGKCPDFHQLNIGDINPTIQPILERSPTIQPIPCWWMGIFMDLTFAFTWWMNTWRYHTVEVSNGFQSNFQVFPQDQHGFPNIESFHWLGEMELSTRFKFAFCIGDATMQTKRLVVIAVYCLLSSKYLRICGATQRATWNLYVHFQFLKHLAVPFVPPARLAS